MRRRLIPRGRTVGVLTADETHTRQERLEMGERWRRKGDEERERRKGRGGKGDEKRGRRKERGGKEREMRHGRGD